MDFILEYPAPASDMDVDPEPVHPAVARIRSAVAENSFTSGTWAVPVASCDLYYRLAQDTLAFVNLAKATSDELQQLIASCDAAPFGRGNQTVMDESYRKALKLDVTQFALSFDLASTSIVPQIQRELVESGASLDRAVRAEPYKLNVYDQGAFFKSHQDTPRSEDMLGSLVIVFPTAHTGGNLFLREKDQVWSFDTGSLLSGSTPDTPAIGYVAFYSDVVHEVEPVTSGARVTLTYNLYFDHTCNLRPNSRVHAKYSIIKEAIQELIGSKAALENPEYLLFGLAHQYSVKREQDKHLMGVDLSDLPRHLKGSDALIYNACKDLKLKTTLQLAYDFEEWDDEEDEDIEKTYLGRKPVTDEKYPVENVHELKSGLKGLDDYDIWVTPRTERNQVQTSYVAYGNEASLGYLYGDVCLVVKMP